MRPFSAQDDAHRLVLCKGIMAETIETGKRHVLATVRAQSMMDASLQADHDTLRRFWRLPTAKGSL
jgi:hypothetical protein